MAILVVQLGSPRKQNEGIRIGTVRRPPRGVRKEDYSKGDYYDLWLPQLSPSSDLLEKVKRMPPTASSWKAFERQFVHELSTPDNIRLLDLLAAFSHVADFSIGCYCENESRCHRSILKKMLKERNASFR
jgi:uncharacterized protein YeaO (DUF488 family)